MEQVIYMMALESITVSPAGLQACMAPSAPQASPRQSSDNICTLGDAISAQK